MLWGVAVWVFGGSGFADLTRYVYGVRIACYVCSEADTKKRIKHKKARDKRLLNRAVRDLTPQQLLLVWMETSAHRHNTRTRGCKMVGTWLRKFSQDFGVGGMRISDIILAVVFA